MYRKTGYCPSNRTFTHARSGGVGPVGRRGQSGELGVAQVRESGGCGADSGEEVVFGDWRSGAVHGPDEALPGEDLLADLRRDLAKPGLADLAGVCLQRPPLA